MRSWSGPYLKGAEVPLDPWGQSYLYATPDRGRSYRITFVGTEGSEAAAAKGTGTTRGYARAEPGSERGQSIRDASR